MQALRADQRKAGVGHDDVLLGDPSVELGEERVVGDLVAVAWRRRGRWRGHDVVGHVQPLRRGRDVRRRRSASERKAAASPDMND